MTQPTPPLTSEPSGAQGAAVVQLPPPSTATAAPVDQIIERINAARNRRAACGHTAAELLGKLFEEGHIPDHYMHLTLYTVENFREAHSDTVRLIRQLHPNSPITEVRDDGV